MKVLILIAFLFMPIESLSFELGELLPQGCAHSGDFSQSTYLVDINKPLTTEGKFIFTCDDGLVWMQQKPRVEAIAYETRGKVYLENEEKLVILKLRHHKELGRLLNYIFSSDTKYIKKHFSVLPVLSADTTGLKVELKPKSARFKRVLSLVEIEKVNLNAAISIHLKNGEKRLLNLSQLVSLESVSLDDCREYLKPFIRICKKLYD